MTRFTRTNLLLLLLCFFYAAVEITRAQEAPPAQEPKPLASIRALRSTIEASAAELEEKQDRLLNASTAAEKEIIGTQIRKLNEKLAALGNELESVATGIDASQLDDQFNKQIDFNAEVGEFFRPLIQEAKRATAKPRELEDLRAAVAFHTKRVATANQAISQLRELIANAKNADTKATLEELEKGWGRRRAEYDNQLITAQYQLDKRLESDGSFWDTLSSGIATFFSTKGKNLIIAVACMAVTLFLMGLLHRGIVRFSPLRKVGNNFTSRLLDVIYFAITALLTVCAGLAAFYALGDWMLFGFSLIIIAGFAWASKNTIPRVAEQIKLMLNLGSVREKERIVLNGIPWQVRKLSIYSSLVNPALEGGKLRLPLRDLIPLSSRPSVPDEPFFPCEKGHWLRLADGTFGKVIRQTPEWVQLVLHGNSVKTFTTAEFISQNPQNLSLGFSVRKTFGIDYSHQAIATDEIPSILQSRIDSSLRGFLSPEEVVNVRVEFASASSSSLDMAVLADFSGEAAAKYYQLDRAIQRICVETCNDHGWIIPFTQITMHQAPAPDLSPAIAS
jgi:hypothetical protein